MNQPKTAARAYTTAQFVLIAAFAAAVFLDPSASNIAGPKVVAPVGLALCALGIALGAAALAAMGRLMQVSPEPKPEGHLVTRGIYRYLRHPMYTAIVLVVIGLWLRKPALLVAIIGIALIALLLRKARFEESLLLERYPGYADYRRGTWGVIPGAGRTR